MKYSPLHQAYKAILDTERRLTREGIDSKWLDSLHDALCCVTEEMRKPMPMAPQAAEQEPVECMCGICKLGKREWVGLTDEEVSYCRYAATFCDELDTAYMAELIEKALEEKNT